MSNLNFRLLQGKVLHFLMPFALILCTYGAMAFDYGQTKGDPLDANIKISKKSEKLGALFSLVEQQTPLRFAYDASEVDINKSISIKKDVLILKQLLLEISQQTGTSFELSKNVITVIPPKTHTISLNSVSSSNAKNVTGKVVDKNGAPVAGATVSVKGTSKGTATDGNGSFRIDANEGDVLVITSVGFEKTEITVGTSSNISVILAGIGTALNEVVVIGYGTQRKAEVTSSVATVKAENFIKGTVKDAGQLIQGKVAGLTIISPNGDPTATSQVILRGQSTLMGVNQNPLVLIDGVPGDLKMVAPQDIESIDVLKDGSAAAIYGTRGTNGVILITTKRAGANNKTTVEYGGYVSIQTIARKLDMSTAEDFRAQIASGDRIVITPTGDTSYPMLDHGASTDWLKEITRTPVSQDHNLTFRGGNATTNYLASVNYNDLQGLFLKSYNQQFSGRMDFNHSMFNNKLKINLNYFSASRKFNGFNSNIYRQATMQNPTAPVKNPDGTWFQELTKFDYQSPVSDLMESDGKSSESNSRYKGSVVFTPITGLRLSGIFSYTKRMLEAGYAETKQHASTLRDNRNGYASVSGNSSIDRLAELTAEYSKSFNRNNFTLLGGYSYQENDYNSDFTNNWDFPTDQFSWHNIGLGRAISSGDYTGLIGSYRATTNLIGFFGRLTYNYDQKYLLMASVRSEEASQLWGTNDPWGTFPAVSAGWRITRESFMDNQKLFNDLKLRAGYGVTGSQPNQPFLGLATLSYGGFVLSNGEWVQTLVPSQNANPNLQWEEKRETNIGLDFSMLDNRIGGSIDLYNRKIHNLLYLFEVPSPPNLYNRTMANVGTMQNKGIEVQVNFVPVRKNNFEWNSTVNYSTNSNKLISLSNDLYKTSTDYIRVGAIFPPIQTFSHLLRVGGEVGDFYGYKVIGVGGDPSDVANYGQWIYEGRDGKPVNYKDFAHAFEDKKVLGNGLPRHYLAWNNSFRLNNWDLTITQRGAFNFQVANLQRMMFENPTQAQYNLMKNAYDPVFGTTQLKSPVEFNSYYIEDGDFWKIDNITLGYNFRKTGTNLFQSARVYVASLNTLIITGYKGIDPEVSLRNAQSAAQSGVVQVPTSGLDPGMDSPYKYPTTRTFSVGLNVTF
ncbi:SusC/RagA family TonB-linked outer membrane protein [Chitinophagaceae bacterium LB-8]|uniref:SusC/RagA family TonB-linked outer membrane protein n=1 Tax=Paraflavisolibacter caeni TaxID=2982496 RepID=A0A9X2XP68_9BACT|nr:SusC/RagA family TonB-linked outer membrane protein [Paraflavisolibacter caeni]MCU7550079.1 SusC/RagA family TonB-linked outer membrane protein [Paraflavisolibacter caeni]